MSVGNIDPCRTLRMYALRLRPPTGRYGNYISTASDMWDYEVVCCKGLYMISFIKTFIC